MWLRSTQWPERWCHPHPPRIPPQPESLAGMGDPGPDPTRPDSIRLGRARFDQAQPRAAKPGPTRPSP
ncbi:hypothetical protein NBRGN_037_00130 [Nocardia brasiliensis NBRC 14402]|nr:hypothetical protein NBRGN_037_00130 [Nocardia brasiliensis NBRC 14402]SUB54009.1 Uncharacterised protein [Nocardia brasiliensis]